MRNQDNNRQACQHTSNAWRLNALAAAMAVAMGGFSAGAFAAAPAANSVIGNTATATYTDASAVTRSATSNTVQTIVQQVGSFTLVANNTRLVAPGGQVVYPHTLTNTGNGSDSFALSSAQDAGDNFDLTGFAIYADADGNGVPDNAVNLAGTSVSLAAGGVFKFVVVGSAPGTATAGQDSVTTITATAAFDGDTAFNTDTATVTADAVLNVTKSANILTGPIGTVVEYTLTYTNTGNNTAREVTITDVIPAGATPATVGGMKYVAGSGVWSAGGALTDAAGADPAGITYEVTGTDLTGDRTISAVITSVAPNVSGTIKFQVRVDDVAATGPGNDGNSVARPGILTNTANYFYDPDNNVNTNNNTASQPTNSVDFLVTQTSAVAANDSTTISEIGGDNDIVEQASAGQGTTVSFTNIIWNNGNGPDSFNVTYANLNPATLGFPAGTSFQLFQADGNNVLQDTTSDGVPNTPVIQPGQYYEVILKATLPAGVTGTGATPGQGYSVVKTATSVNDPTKVDTVTDTLAQITSNVVDLSNNTTPTLNANGAGSATDAGTVDNSGAAWSTKSVNPGASTTFPLLIQNKVGIADNYNLAAGSTAGMAALPSGWTVVFRADGGAGNCTTVGATLTNTGTINALGSRLVCAVVTTPVTQTPTTQSVYFKVTSPVSNATDTKLDAVTVNTYRDLQMITNRTGQVFPGGSVVYEHILTNNGNVPEGDAGTEMLLTGVNSLAGFSTVLYIDTNNNGVLDAADAAINGVSGTDNFHTVTVGATGTGMGNGLAGLSPGESVRIFAKVQAPAGATPGTTDSATITADVVGVISGVAAPTDPVNTDTTNVIGGQIRLDKTQALDAGCDGNADGAFAATTLNALPGACIMYRIVATNEGVSQVTSVLINDTTPSFTTLYDKVVGGIVTTATTPVVTGSGTNNTVTTKPADGAAGALIADVGALNGGQSGTFTFSVRIDN
ncbi:MAG: DUF11 domain-containing protein [Moraxellaceae bacterium]|nr:DUF11 domain-containing protein [Moraxellaceae bacterium]MCP5177644.1 DUF11 domain-containing protein [Moraxellaceae bacterium]